MKMGKCNHCGRAWRWDKDIDFENTACPGKVGRNNRRCGYPLHRTNSQLKKMPWKETTAEEVFYDWGQFLKMDKLELREDGFYYHPKK